MAAISALFLTAVFCDTGTPAAAKAPPAAITAAYPDLTLKIGQAKALLAEAPIGYSRNGSGNAALAVWDGSPDGEIRLVSIRDGISRTPGFTVERKRYNGVNSDYRVTEPEGYVVLAGKFDVGRGRSRRTAVYTPYTPGLHTPEMVAAGRAYLEALLDRAASELAAAGTASLADPGKLVTGMVDARTLLAILVVEHVRYDQAEELGLQRVVEEVLVVLAANGDDAFDHAVSRARAQGLAQFIKSSYLLTRRRYPAAGLPADFNAGTTDHLNAAKAQYCLADWTLAALKKETLADLRLPGFEEDLGAYIAAGYNGGERRAAGAFYRYPGEWEKPRHGLWRETVTYVRVFRAVYRQLFPAPDPATVENRTFDP